MPPATLAAYIGVIVSTSMAIQGSTIYGNIAELVVVQVDASSPYGSDPGHPGFGTVAAVIRDGAGFFACCVTARPLDPSSAVKPESGLFGQIGPGLRIPRDDELQWPRWFWRRARCWDLRRCLPLHDDHRRVHRRLRPLMPKSHAKLVE
jgi:hypothetical protein